jgi:hypothetical protein
VPHGNTTTVRFGFFYSAAAAVAPNSTWVVPQLALRDAVMPPNDENTLGLTNLDTHGNCPAGR